MLHPIPPPPTSSFVFNYSLPHMNTFTFISVHFILDGYPYLILNPPSVIFLIPFTKTPVDINS